MKKKMTLFHSDINVVKSKNGNYFRFVVEY